MDVYEYYLTFLSEVIDSHKKEDRIGTHESYKRCIEVFVEAVRVAASMNTFGNTLPYSIEIPKYMYEYLLEAQRVLSCNIGLNHFDVYGISVKVGDFEEDKMILRYAPF